MAQILFHLAGASEQEIEDIRALLLEHELPVYETSAGRWMLGVGAIWIKDDSRYQEARALINAYQREREQAPKPEPLSMWQHMQQQPLPFVLALLGLIVVAVVSVLPFMLRGAGG